MSVCNISSDIGLDISVCNVSSDIGLDISLCNIYLLI